MPKIKPGNAVHCTDRPENAKQNTTKYNYFIFHLRSLSLDRDVNAAKNIHALGLQGLPSG